MRSWAGTAADQRGKKFTRQVAERMKELGWQVDVEVPVTKLLERGFDRDYGDVDVFAWNLERGRARVIECKDLQFKKTHGEIAEQLSDCRGETRNGKPDLLRKHIDRVDLLAQHPIELAAFLGSHARLSVEGWIVFRHPVPMQFVWRSLEVQLRWSIFDQLDRIIGCSLRFSRRGPSIELIGLDYNKCYNDP